MHRPSQKAFSLIEVVISIAIFALTIVALVAMLAPVSRDTDRIRDSETASRLASSIERELNRLNFETVRSSTVPPNSLYLVATRDGSRVLRTGINLNDPTTQPGSPRAAENNLDTGTPPGIADRDRYFLIEVRRFPAGDPALQVANPSQGNLPLIVTISWPFRLPQGPAPDPLPVAWNDPSVLGTNPPASVAAQRNSLRLPVSITP
jgi:type II secretory pathway pseudopilin PulG